MEKTRRTEYYLAALVAAATFLVYLHALKNGFVNRDDFKFICENTHIRSLNMAFVKWAFSNFSFSSWYPLTWFSHALTYALWGLDPEGYHLVNIILHSMNTFLVFMLTARLIGIYGETGLKHFNETGKFIAAAATGLLFGLHPLRVESVAWASERKDVLCGLFFLLALASWLNYAAGTKAPSPGGAVFFRRRYLVPLFFFLLAVMSKPMAVSFPLVLLILDWFPLERIKTLSSFGAAVFEKLPFIALSGCVSALTLMSANGRIIPLKSAPFTLRALVAAKSLALYLWKTIFPLDLVPYYPYPKTVSFLAPGYILPALLVMAISAFCLITARKNRLWLACWGYFIITLLPVMGIVQVRHHWIADRYTYLPGLGLFLAAGAVVAWAWGKVCSLEKYGKTARGLYAAAVFLPVLSMAYLTFTQIGVWKNSVVFWNYVIGKEPGTPLPYYSLGIFLFREKSYGQAAADFRASIRAEPGYLPANVALATLYARTGQSAEAEKVLQAAITHTPDPGKLSIFHNNLGQLYLGTGAFGKAIPEFQTAVRLQPGCASIHYNLGSAYMRLTQLGPAAREFQETLKLDPSCLAAKRDLEVIASLAGQGSR